MGLAKQFVQAFLKILQSFGILASAKLLAGVMQMDTRQELEPGVDSWPLLSHLQALLEYSQYSDGV